MVMKEHIVASFDEELSDLSQKIAEMGGIAELQVADSVAALARRDANLAQTVIVIDYENCAHTSASLHRLP